MIHLDTVISSMSGLASFRFLRSQEFKLVGLGVTSDHLKACCGRSITTRRRYLKRRNVTRNPFKFLGISPCLPPMFSVKVSPMTTLGAGATFEVFESGVFDRRGQRVVAKAARLDKLIARLASAASARVEFRKIPAAKVGQQYRSNGEMAGCPSHVRAIEAGAPINGVGRPPNTATEPRRNVGPPRFRVVGRRYR